MTCTIERKEKLNFCNHVFWCVIYFVIAYSLTINNASIITIAVVCSAMYCIFAKVENIFALLCGLSMFEAVFKVQDDNAWFLLLLILSAKILFRRNMMMKAGYTISCIFIISLELILDFSNVSYGQLLVDLTCIIFVFCAFGNIENLKVNVYDILFSMSFSFFGVVYYVLTMDGGIGKFLKSFMSASYAYRFGHAYGDTVGGAMAIPLYAALIISCSITILLLKKNDSLYQNILIIFSSFVALIVGAMTVSRSFYLCLLITLLFFLFFKSNNNKMSKIGIILLIIVGCAFLFFSESQIVEKVFSSLQLRMDAGVEEGTGGRTDIWLSCVNYLLDHPLRLLFGCGASYYPQLGALLNEMFSAGSHSLILDLMMSWGICGTVIILMVCILPLKHALQRVHNLSKHSFMPLITYLTFAMTALRCCNMKTWMFLFVAFSFIIQLNKGENYDT